MTLPHNFGDPWTQKKLEALQKYLRAYIQIFQRTKKQNTLQQFMWMHLPEPATEQLPIKASNSCSRTFKKRTFNSF